MLQRLYRDGGELHWKENWEHKLNRISKRGSIEQAAHSLRNRDLMPLSSTSWGRSRVW